VDSIDAYQKFLAQYPQGHWAREAQVRIDAFASGNGAGSGAAAATVSGASANAAPAAPAGESSAGAGAVMPDGGPPPLSAGYGVQLGAFSSAERANEEWKKLAAGTAGTLDGLNPRVVVGEASGKTIYRLQAEVRDEAQARAVCGGLKAAKKPCVPVIPATHP
jgi:cell division protein FtsN